ncbi:protein-glutamate methylesterase/protein-glutamine glutaminase [Clostridium coskatii]|uniref:Protein-glutamate methylesterase/protein-glutamine glutaminase n=1 Tax=Clostridium coskatii TaxID=1705578 RepID=A0A162LHM9_9CLOT|nr:chemotaxis response regulator protein-glutamate methylesterase [Clostridium coskatii]OAA93636.1 Chemotaxis response regulator protein-glutamate methylesterase [Clostridium coskatii]OBR90002.1 chemotaxis response regulator protein-glutamate methylesterase [Clostridium coskatii]
MEKIKVLVVDDSALMRKIISDMIGEDESIRVVGTARNGEDLLEKLSLNFTENSMPDVITLDVEMPKMDGITALGELKKRNINIPVIVLSSVSKEGKQRTMECLDMGAFDFLPKPSGTISLDINKVKTELVEKIKGAYLANTVKPNKAQENMQLSISKNEKASTLNVTSSNVDRKMKKDINAVVIGASTGGPKALYSVITQFPQNMGVPVFVVQHMPAGFTKAFADRLDSNSKIKVLEAEDGMNVEKNTVYVAPGGFHMEVWRDKRIHLNKEPAIWGVRPAVDKLFISASKVYGENIISVVLTGMGRDGAQGTVEIKENGGITLSEDESTCTIYGMPKAAYATGKVDLVLPIDKIANEIVKIIKFGGR